MNLELGAYAGTVLGAYGVTLVLLGGLVAVSLARAARLRRDLSDLEGTRRETRNG
ncbi:MAG: heme exporter protein CcmD [Pseudomonadota bacterium]